MKKKIKVLLINIAIILFIIVMSHKDYYKNLFTSKASVNNNEILVAIANNANQIKIASKVAAKNKQTP